YAPSLTALYLSKRWADGRQQRPDRPLWALGDPIFDAQDARLGTKGKPAPLAAASAELSWLRGGAFRRLPHTAREVQAVRNKLEAPPEAVVLGRDATEARVTKASADGVLARARYVHFATHGVVGLDRGQPPGLVLSQVGNDGREGPGGKDDGFLRLPEV